MTDYPIRTIELPWSVRGTFQWTRCCVYQPGKDWDGRPGRYSVRIGHRDDPALVEQLPGFMDAWSELRYNGPRFKYQQAVSSYLQPWVRHGKGVEQLIHELQILDASNVTRDQVFEGRDLVLHVQGYDSMTNRYWQERYGGHHPGPFSLLGLVGVEIVGSGNYMPSLQTVPPYRKAQ